MITKEQRLALNSKGYDLIFEWKGKPYALKSESLPSWDEEKKAKFRQESGLDFTCIGNEWVFYNPEQYVFNFGGLKYVGNSEKPDQPINLTDYAYLFEGWNGSYLNLSHWNVSDCRYFNSVFRVCKNLQSVDLSNWDVSNSKDFRSMFTFCESLQSLDLSSWSVSNSESFGSMFNGCASLQSLDLSNWDVSNSKDFSSMFSDCKSLQSLNLSGWDVSNSKDFSYMFNGCVSLQSLDLSGWDVSKSESFSSMFSNCKSLQSLDLSNWVTNQNACVLSMFNATGIAEINERLGCELVALLLQGRWSEVKQGSIQGTLQESKLF